jgi:hypothetical protein
MVSRHIENNPVRVKLVEEPETYTCTAHDETW